MGPPERDTAGLGAAAEPAIRGYRSHVWVPIAAGGVGNVRLPLALIVAGSGGQPD